jgi:hypothetical protein
METKKKKKVPSGYTVCKYIYIYCIGLLMQCICPSLLIPPVPLFGCLYSNSVFVARHTKLCTRDSKMLLGKILYTACLSCLSCQSFLFSFYILFFFLSPDGQLRSSWHLSLLRAVVVVVVIPGGVRLSFSLLVHPHVLQKSFVFIGKTHRKNEKKKTRATSSH